MKTVTGSADATSTLTLTLPQAGTISGKKKYQIRVQSITVTTSEADIAKDVAITVTSATSETWKAFLRSAAVHGAHFQFDGFPLVSKGGDMVITATAAGAACKTTISAAYEII
jgi:hypothetical protein